MKGCTGQAALEGQDLPMYLIMIQEMLLSLFLLLPKHAIHRL